VISPLYAEKQTRTIGRIHLIGAFISLLANFVLISVYGMIGAAFAILATFLYIFVAITIASTRVSEVQWQWAKVMRVIIIALAVAILGRAVDTGSLWLDVAVKSTILIVMVPLLYTIAFPRDSEQSIVRRLWAALGGRNAAASLPQEAAHAKDAQTVK
jgi:peptidoglycan biosynthesis protein MviN/MurJ (putative lipid II flippase)